MVMMSAEAHDDNGSLADDPIADYRQSLSDLVINSKPMIMMLTMLAEDYKDTKAKEIVDCIQHRLFLVSPDQKLPTLYLIDSICKNLTNSDYVRLFEKKLIKLFSHTFERSDEKTRISLFKLRQTWNVVFNNEILYNLDVAIQKLDSNWPIVKLITKSTEQKLTGNNADIKVPIDQSIIPVAGNSQIINKRSSIIQKESIELDHVRNVDTIKNTPKQHVIRDANFLFQNSNTRVNKKSSNKSEKKNKRRNSMGISAKTRKKELQNDRANTSKPMLKKPKVKKRKLPHMVQSPLPPPKKSKKSPIDTTVPLPVAPDDVIPLGQNHHKSVSKWSKPETRPQSVVSSLKSRRISPIRNCSHSPPSSRSRSPPNCSSSTSTIQTTIPAPNVFVQPEVLFGFPSMCESSVTKSLSPSQSTWNSQPENPPTQSFAMDRDYRNEFDTFVNEAQNKLNAGAITTTDHDVLVREAEKHLYEMQNNHQFMSNNHLPPPNPLVPPMPSQPNMFQGIVEPHGSVKVFINNEMRRLYYLDNITSIVLMKVHPDTPFDQLISCDPVPLEPKQVYFSGQTTTVFIDRGLPTELSFRLEFNNPVPLTFYFSGSPMAHGIMLGLPARELIIDARPYQIAFGGPPINVFFDCEGQYHTFQLSDSRPLLKFSDELRCDLWIRLINEAKSIAGIPIDHTQYNNGFGYAPPTTMTANMNHPIVNNYPQPTTQPSQFIQPAYDAPLQPMDPPASLPPVDIPKFPDLNSLLSKLTAVGLIKTAAEDSSKVIEPHSKVEKKPLPPKKYLPLEVSVLKKPDQSVIDQLFSGVQCTNCSLRFSDDALKDENGKKSRYARHLDWHFRQNRREKAKPGSSLSVPSQRRPWFYTSDSWILYREVYDDIAEDSVNFFELNATNSPSQMPISMYNFDFSKFKDLISNYDEFIEVINYDTNATNVGQHRICSVVSGSDESLNSCAVCNEAFELKWNEDDEEWRLMNAVRFGSKGDGDLIPVRIYHPLCLKDFIIQQDRVIDNDDSFNASTNLECESSNTRKVVIPGLDTVADNEDLIINQEPKNDIDNANIQDVEVTVKQEIVDNSDLLDESQGDVPADQINEEENFDIKVVEFEIPIVGSIKTECSTTTTASTEKSVTVNATSESMDTVNSSSVDHNTKQTMQPKRGGIVIKMKKFSNNNIVIPTVDNSNVNVLPSTQQTGNVSSTDDSNSCTEIQSIDTEIKCDPLTDINSDCNKRINIDMDADDDNDDVVGGDGGNSVVESCTQPNNNTLMVYNVVSGVKQDFIDNSEQHQSDDCVMEQTNIEQVTTCSVNVDDNGDIGVGLIEQDQQPNTITEQGNYYRRGREESSLCTIM